MFPVVAVVEMVLGGEGGAFLPAEEIENSIDLWNGVLVTITHPKVRGQHVNANRKDVADQFGVGRLHNVTSKDGKLLGDVFFDLARVGEVNDADTVEEMVRATMEDGEPRLEGSTSYLAWSEPTRGTHNGVGFSSVQRGLIPEHFALLPNGIGKCSIDDGCGGPRLNEQEDSKMTIRERMAQKWDKVREALGLTVENQLSDESKREVLRSALMEEFGTDDNFVWVHATFDDTVVFHQEEAGGEVGLFRISFSMGSDGEGPVEFTGEVEEVREIVTFEAVENDEGAEDGESAEAGEADPEPASAGTTNAAADGGNQSTSQETNEMNRKEMIDRIINSKAVPFGCREDLEKFEDEQLSALNDMAVAAETADGTGDGDAPAADAPEGTPEGEGDPAEAAPAAPAGDVAVALSADTAFVRELREQGATPKALAAMLAKHNADAEVEAESRDALIETVVNNGHFERVELEGMATSAIRKIAEPRFYGGRGGPRSKSANAGETYVDRQPRGPRVSDAIREARGLKEAE